MNDQNNNNQPPWVRPHLSDQISEESNNKQQPQLSPEQSQQPSSLDHTRPPQHNPNEQKGSLLQSIGQPCYNFISKIGHCGLFCEETIRKWLFAPSPSKRSSFLKYSLGSVVVLLVSLSVLYMFMGWRALPVTFLKASIEASLAANMGATKVQIDEALLQRDTERGGLYIRLTNMVLLEPDGAVIAASPQTAIGLKFFPLLMGVVAADNLSLIGPEIHFMRNADGDWTLLRSKLGSSGVEAKKIEFNEQIAAPQKEQGADLSAENLAQIGDVIKEGLSGVHGQMRQAQNLSYIGVRKARIIMHQEAGDEGQVWLMPSFTVQYDQDEKKQLVGSGIITPQNAPQSEIWLALSHNQGDSFVDMKARLQNVVPGQLSTFVPALSSLSAVQLGVSGAFTGRIDLSNGLQSGQMKIVLSEGSIGFLGNSAPGFEITRGTFEFTMEAGANHISLVTSELVYPAGHIVLKGDIWRENAASGPQDWRFQIFSTEGQILSGDPTVNGQTIDEFGFSGRLFASKMPVLIDEMRVKIGKSSILMAHDGSYGYPAILRGRFKHLPLNLIKAIWPQGFKQESRDWVFKHMQSGVLSNGRFAIAGLGKTQELVQITQTGFSKTNQDRITLPEMNFEIEGLSFTIFDNPLLLQSKKANLAIRGDRLDFTMRKGFFDVPRGGRITVKDAHLLIPDVVPVGPDGVVSFNLTTNAKTSIALLQREPFGFNSAIQKSLNNFKGAVGGNLVINLPLREEIDQKEVKVAGLLTLTKAEAKVNQFKLSNGDIKFNLGNNHVEAKGSMLVNGVTTTLAWRRQFNHSEGYINPPLIIRGNYDEADRNQLGLPINHLVQGPVPVEVTFAQKTAGKVAVHLAADLTKATLISQGLGWRKESGRTASLNFDVVDRPGKGVFLENFNIEGQDITARGQVLLSEKSEVKSFSFPEVSYKIVSNISVTGERRTSANGKKKFWKVNARGKSFDGRGIFRSILHKGQVGSAKSSAIANSDGVELTAKFNTVLGWQQSRLNNVSIQMKRRGDELQGFSLRSKLRGGGTLNGKLVNNKGQDPVIQLDTTDAGEALRLVGFYPSMLGGRGRLTVRYNVKKRQLASKTGELIIQNFSIASDPVVKEVLANIGAGKKNKKLGSQDVVKFKSLVAPFSIGHEQFILHDSQVKGEILGATMRGQIDFQRNQVRLSGTYIPLYGLNAAVGIVPVLGDILVGRRGEGMLGITFGIYGPIEKPEVLVNPMSLVAPGVFRQIFEFNQGKPKIKLRTNSNIKSSTKLNSSASKVQRRNKKTKNEKQRGPETSSSLQRK